MTAISRPSRTNSAFNNTLIFSFSTVFVNVCLYLYQLFAGRILTVDEYGILNGYIALESLLCIPMMAFSFFTVRYVALAYERGGEEAAVHLSWWLFRRIHIVSAILYGSLLGVSPFIARAFGFTSMLLVALTVVTAYAMVYLSFLRSIPYAKKIFLPFSINSSIEMIVRVVCGAAFGILGWGAFGVFLWFPVGILASLVLIFTLQRHTITGITTTDDTESTHFIDTDDMRRYLVPSILLTMMLVLLSSIDMLYAQIILSDKDLGIYASATMLGRIITFSLGIFVGVATPYFPEWWRYKKFLGIVYALLVGGGIVFLGIYTYIPDLLVHSLFGARYDAAIPILPFVAVVSVAYSLLTFVITHRVVAGVRGYASIGILFPVCIGIVLILLAPHTLIDLPITLLWGYGGCAMILGTGLVTEILQKPKLRESRN